jgi:hypothetical protein
MVVEAIKEQQLGREAVVAMRAVAEAADLARVVEQGVAAGALSKGNASPVTIADFSVQALIAARLGRDCPSDTLVAEEDATALRKAPDLSSRVIDVVRQADAGLHPDQILDWIDRGGGSPGPRFWVLDPIDGTKGLLTSVVLQPPSEVQRRQRRQQLPRCPFGVESVPSGGRRAVRWEDTASTAPYQCVGHRLPVRDQARTCSARRSGSARHGSVRVLR